MRSHGVFYSYRLHYMQLLHRLHIISYVHDNQSCCKKIGWFYRCCDLCHFCCGRQCQSLHWHSYGKGSKHLWPTVVGTHHVITRWCNQMSTLWLKNPSSVTFANEKS